MGCLEFRGPFSSPYTHAIRWNLNSSTSASVRWQHDPSAPEEGLRRYMINAETSSESISAKLEFTPVHPAHNQSVSHKSRLISAHTIPTFLCFKGHWCGRNASMKSTAGELITMLRWSLINLIEFFIWNDCMQEIFPSVGENKSKLL